MYESPKQSRNKTLLAAALLSACLGSIHAFSIFIAPLEAAFDLPRATVSLTYSFALVTLTAAVTLGPAIYARLSPARIFLTATLLAATGAWVASLASSITAIWLGYSLAFGAANGLGYGFGLQFAAQSMPERKGWAMGVVTAAYALGAAHSPLGFDMAIQQGGVALGMQSLAAALLFVGILATLLVAQSRQSYTLTSTPKDQAQVNILPLWIAYGAGVTAGLMAIGHAAGIAEARGFTGWTAPAILALCNLTGSLTGGLLIDRRPPGQTLTTLALITAAALACLALMPPLTLAALGLIGLAYGGTIAAYPAAIAKRHPDASGPKIYGKVFTAWGAAGLAAPWFAGVIFDQSGSYSAALWIAAAIALASALTARALFSPSKN